MHYLASRSQERPGAAVLPDIAAVVGGEDHRLRHGNRPLADLLVINIERHLAALAKTAASIGELYAQLVLAAGSASVASTKKWCTPATL